MLEKALGAEAPIIEFQSMQPSEGLVTSADTTTLRKHVERSPAMPLDGLVQFMDWHRV